MSILELKIPPVAVTLLLGALMWLLSNLLPGPHMGHRWAYPLAALFLTAATATGLAGVASFRAARTTVNPLDLEQSSALVTSGIFRYSRNPMYLALLFTLIGWALLLGSPLSLTGAAAFIAWMNRFQIAPEEQALRRLFGEEFDEYSRRVRRWL